MPAKDERALKKDVPDELKPPSFPYPFLAPPAVLALSFLLPTEGVIGVVRLVLCGATLLTVPGLSLRSRTGNDSDWIVKALEVVVISMAFYVLVGYVAVTIHVRISPGVFVLPAVALGCVPLLRRRASLPGRIRLRGNPLLLLGGVAVAAAMVTHLALPSAPVESSFSLAVPVARLTGNMLIVPVEVTRVQFPGPIRLTVYVNNVSVEHESITAAADRVTIEVRLPRRLGRCGLDVLISASDGAYISPYVLCRA